MGLTSLQVCMDSSSDWLLEEDTIHEDIMDSSSVSPSATGVEDMLTCSRPLMERRLRPQHDQSLKCPRCDSTHTKFCYYNNYSLSQPRYFCKTCRRYWTKGGTLRNIPVGGGCRKSNTTSKKSSSSSSSKKSSINNDHQLHHHHPSTSTSNLGPSSPILLNNPPTHDLQLSFPHDHHLTNFVLPPGIPPNHHFFMDNCSKYNNHFMLQNPIPFDFMLGSCSSSRNTNHDLIQDGGNTSDDQMGSILNCHDAMNNPSGLISPQNFPNFSSQPFGVYVDGNTNATTNTMLPYETNHHHQNHIAAALDLDVKPNAKHLSLEWHDHQHHHHHQGCSDVVAKDSSFHYFNGVGSSSWPGLMNGYGTSATNPLV